MEEWKKEVNAKIQSITSSLTASFFSQDSVGRALGVKSAVT